MVAHHYRGLAGLGQSKGLKAPLYGQKVEPLARLERSHDFYGVGS